MKEIPKYIFSPMDRMYSHLNEPQLMKRLNKYDFGIKLISSFKDYDNIYLITTFFEGKTLDHYSEEIMNEEKIKFISACIIQSLIYFRKEEIIHRDIHLKNVIMDSDNYFNIIDFSSAINYEEKNNSNYYIKTNGYVAPPEMLRNKEYYFNSDYYRFGSIIYYLIFKKYPNVIKKENNLKEISIDYKKFNNYSYNCIDFINKLIIADPKKRIGFKDINEIKDHPWFKNINWNKLEKKQIKSPFNYMYNNSDKHHDCSKLEIPNHYIERYRKASKTFIYKQLIKKFEFCDISNITKFL